VPREAAARKICDTEKAMEPAWVDGLMGGLLIGLGAAVMLLGNGRIVGASGILRGFLGFQFDGAWMERMGFVAALVAVPVIYTDMVGKPVLEAPFDITLMAIGGLIVGIGARLANGCTSGHGVCGLARLSKRSAAATATFMATAAVTVFVVRHVLGA
jgi:uncharacterized membrane protein YedE/YeeE